MLDADNELNLTSENIPQEKKNSLIEAMALIEEKDYKSALSVLYPIADDLDFALPYSLIGTCFKYLGDEAKAKSYFESALTKDNKTPYTYISLANFYYENGNVELAIRYWSYASTLSVDDSTLLLNLACAYSQKELRIQAIMYYEKYLRYTKDRDTESYQEVITNISKIRSTAVSYNNAAKKYYDAKLYQKAIEAYESSVSNYPLQPQVYKFIGNLYVLTRNLKSAAENFINAYLVSGFELEYVNNLPMIYEHMNLYSYAYYFCYILLDNASQNPNLNAAQLKEYLVQLGMKVFQKGEEYSSMHLKTANLYETNNDYLKAHLEYNIAWVLTKNNKKQIEEAISRISGFVNPEQRIINSLQFSLTKALKDSEPKLALEICDKILSLAKVNTPIYSLVKQKKTECLKLLDLLKN